MMGAKTLVTAWNDHVEHQAHIECFWDGIVLFLNSFG